MYAGVFFDLYGKKIYNRAKGGIFMEYIEKIAREQYGYAKPDERVYYDSSVY